MSSEVPLSDIAEIVMGQSPQKSEVNTAGHGIPLLNGPTEFTTRHPIPIQFTERGRKFAEKGDILFCVRGSTTGRMNYADQRYAIGRGIGAIRGKNGFPTEYVRAVLEQNLNHLLQAATGSTFPNVGRETLKNFKVNIIEPSKAQQVNELIVALESKSYLNHQTNQTLEQIAQAIFKSWFVDFEPVKAKINALAAGGSEEDALLAAMQAISGKNKAQLTRLQTDNPEHYNQLRTTAELFPCAMQDSELGEIPEGWEATPFEELLEKTIGGDWGKEEPDEKHTEEVKILRGTDLPNVYSGNDDKVPTRYVEAKKLKSRQLKPWDIVIEVSGGSKGQPTGRSLLITDRLLERLGRSEPASFCRMFRPINENVSLLLALHLQKIYADGKTWLYQNQSTGISNFQTKTFLSKEIVTVPPSPVQEAFFKMVNPLIERIYANESTLLGALRDALLPKLLSGEINIAEESNNQSTDEFNKES